MTETLVLHEDVVIGDLTFKRGRYALASRTDTSRMFARLSFTRHGKLSTRGKLFVFGRKAGEGEDKGDGKVCLGRWNCAAADYSIGTMNAFSRARARQALVYNGRIGDKVTLGYREFSHGASKAAQSNDVAYDLSASKLLSYKGARIEVIDAGNTEITYRVLAGFE